jgi:hypothetical protein
VRTRIVDFQLGIGFSWLSSLFVSLLVQLFVVTPFAAAEDSSAPSPAEVRSIARDAYVYGFPMVDGYRIQYAYFVDAKDREYKAPWNQLVNIPRVYTPDDKAVQTPNSDTPYSMIGLDLRTEPIVLTVPAIESGRYFSVQLVDLYTHNFGYLGSRTTGNGGGDYLIAGPGWKGEVPKGIEKVIRAETELVIGIFRTQLFEPSDLENVKRIQAGYRARPLSAFLGSAPPKPAPAIDFAEPLTPEAERTSLELFELLDFVLQFCPTDPSEQALMERFARIGIGPKAREPFEADRLKPESRHAFEQGIVDAWADQAALKKRIDVREITSRDLFGTREHLANDYARRMAGAVLGIYANSAEEAMYPAYTVDSAGRPLDGSANGYTVRFAPGELPPVHAFWSLTLYELPSSLLSANPIDRYLINSPMLPQLERDPDGGLTLHVQHASPGADRESNWLPAPAGPFFMVLRLYWPGAEALDGGWAVPPLEPAG